ncbi:hypothetical protein CGLO_17659 [Colletotrichum gloeosporioides Cg-14]|uniref:Uncharacterized protein n=1 Tax=Colletotrichum gloeosporioides (strain Cg-14) TaxID=1237896 RepID=T0L5V5_COLGC|nr:hypothetical protein CGLO_17659 [Colletotrichum gloeosporioides Cg-14]
MSLVTLCWAAGKPLTKLSYLRCTSTLSKSCEILQIVECTALLSLVPIGFRLFLENPSGLREIF